jgi:glyoxylase-like metal-dependent hydrolase (beta-lactamase superfamily II)
MNIRIVQNGDLFENCYLLEKENRVLIIDPGSEFDKINSYVEDNEVIGILITHRHKDHIGALEEAINTYKCPVYEKLNLEEETYNIGPFSFNVIFNPGHTPDSITFYFYKEHIMFVGDFIFEGNIGRCDLPGGDMNEMMKSIQKIKSFPDDTTIYSGHGEFTKLGHEKRWNYYFNK